MHSNSQTPVTGDVPATKPNGKDRDGKAVVSSAEPIKRVDQTGDSFATAISGDSKPKKSNGKAVVYSAGPKLNGKSVVSASTEVLFFRDVKFGPQEGELRFRLIHFWEARNAHTKVLFGLELLLIDGQGTVIQGFVPPNRIETYLPHMFAGSVYRLNNFYGSKSKVCTEVAGARRGHFF
uniref:DUF223 domain-containing protein n=1 Tax=Brassica campestris TaxID=3711 RepID=A0A3P6CAV7_BRACM|nr:unnamed protein product [Brassica rapa]